MVLVGVCGYIEDVGYRLGHTINIFLVISWCERQDRGWLVEMSGQWGAIC